MQIWAPTFRCKVSLRGNSEAEASTLTFFPLIVAFLPTFPSFNQSSFIYIGVSLFLPTIIRALYPGLPTVQIQLRTGGLFPFLSCLSYTDLPLLSQQCLHTSSPSPGRFL